MIQSSPITFFLMGTLRNKKKFAGLNKENCEENPRNKLAKNISVAKSQKVYNTQIAEEIEGRITKKFLTLFLKLMSFS